MSGSSAPLCVACWVVAGETHLPGSGPELTAPSEAEPGTGDVVGPAAPRRASGRLDRGAEIGRYRIIDELGRGGMAVVYRATQPGLEREVALKVLRTSDMTPAQHIERFLREGQAAARLSHPNVIPVFDVGEADGVYFLAMEFVRGDTLDARVRGGGLHWKQAVAWVRDIARGLHYAHAQGVVHRDVKPANVMITESGVPRVADFGLARLDDAGGLTAEGTAIGTPSYMAPEQAAGETKRIGPATDVYALGAVLYECLTGAPPFTGGSVLEILRAVQMQSPAPIRDSGADVPRDLVVVVDQCLEKEPGDRYATAHDLAEDLDRILRGESVSVRPVGPVTRLGRGVRRRPAAAIAAVAVTVALGVAGWAAWYTSGGSTGGPAKRDTLRAAAKPHYDKAVERLDAHRRLRRAGDAPAAFAALDAAVDAIGIALREDPAYAEAYLVRARIRRQNRHLSGAISDYEAAINLDPSLIDAYYERVRLRFDHDFATLVGLGGSDPVETAAIIEDLTHITDSDESPERRYIAAAMVQLLSGRYESAQQLASDAIRESPQSADAYSVRGIARTTFGVVAVWTGRAVTGNAALAGGLADFDTALKLGADPVSISPGRSQVLAGLGRVDEALAEINQTVEFDNSDHLAVLLRARLLMLHGQPAAAEADLASAVELAGETAEIRVARALVRLVPAVAHAGQRTGAPPSPRVERSVEHALDDLNWVVAHAPSYHIARFYRAIGQFTRLDATHAFGAVVGADFQLFIAENPSDSDLGKAAARWLALLRAMGVGDASVDATVLWEAAADARAADALLAAGEPTKAAERYASVASRLESYEAGRPVDDLVGWRTEFRASLLQRAHRGTARARAIEGEGSAALDALQRAVEAGYRDLSQVSRDRAFANLVENPRFKAVIAPMR